MARWDIGKILFLAVGSHLAAGVNPLHQLPQEGSANSEEYCNVMLRADPAFPGHHNFLKEYTFTKSKIPIGRYLQ